MASDALRSTSTLDVPRSTPTIRRTDRGAVVGGLLFCLRGLASLQLTVVLFGMSIFIVWAGTLAQIDKDVWQVVHEFFRNRPPMQSGFAWIDFQLFFPRNVHVPGGFYFPGGWLIGAAMAVNLIAAHAVRFKIQAKGLPLLAGLAVIVVGWALVGVVVINGDQMDGTRHRPLIEYATLWKIQKTLLAAVWLTMLYGLLRVGRERKLQWRMLLVGVAILGPLVAWLYWRSDLNLGDSSMRILWQLTQGGLASLVLLAGCTLAFRKRAGIVLIHAGVGFLMLSEVLVGTMAEEGQMRIEEGQTVNYVEDIRDVELAVIDHSGAEEDHVVAVPGALVRRGRRITHPDLPFDIQVVKYFQNTRLYQAQVRDPDNPSTAGIGLIAYVEDLPPATGIDDAGGVDVPSAYVTLYRKGTDEALDTYLVSVNLDAPETVNLDGKPYDLLLRFKRSYRDFSIYLADVRAENYVGTATPRDYSSHIHLVAPEQKVNRDIRIWMNNPLRFAGETYYQSGYTPATTGRREVTTLQVVTNTGWMIPYISCMIVGTGLLAQFGGSLLRFLRRYDRPEPMGRAEEVVQTELFGDAAVSRNKRRRAERQFGAAEAGPDRSVDWGATAVAVLITVAMAGRALADIRPAHMEKGGMDLAAVGCLPVAYEGRVKPLDTVARNALKKISGRETFKDSQDSTRPAIEWLLDVICNTNAAGEHKVFRIYNFDVQETLGLEPRPGYLYALDEFSNRLGKLDDQAKIAGAKDASQRSTFERKVLELANNIQLFDLLQEAFRIPELRIDAEQEVLDADIQREIARRSSLSDVNLPMAVPPRGDVAAALAGSPMEKLGANWQPYTFAILEGLSGDPNPAIRDLTAILQAYRTGNAGEFNAAVAEYRDHLAKLGVQIDAYRQQLLVDQASPEQVAQAPPALDATKTDFEAYYNHFAPLFSAMVLYVGAFVLFCLSFLFWRRYFSWAAIALVLVGLGLHTFGLVARMYISGRPPVTNLYSSAVFIGWAAVVLSLVFEAIFRLGVAGLVGALAGWITLQIAQGLSVSGDTFTVLQAVLDTQFWLATHVVCVTLGYATTLLAGLLGVAYILYSLARRLGMPEISPENSGRVSMLLGAKFGGSLGKGAAKVASQPNEPLDKTLARMIYGTICFGMLFSFIGTVLGGLWADDSWGRFWGWDPKENGALIIVLWNALVLHARWGGMVRGLGLATLAVVGNIVTLWSWFGVNLMGVGLHSYGFTEGAVQALTIAVLAHLAIIGTGCLLAGNDHARGPTRASTPAT